MHRRVTDDDVAADKVPLDAASHKEAVGIPGDRVVLNDAVVGASTREGFR